MFQTKIQDDEEKHLVTIVNGQIVSYEFKGEEFWHGGGKPEDMKLDADKLGWPHSEIVMFPIIGKSLDHKVVNPDFSKSVFPLDQHGISRALNWELLDDKDNSFLFRQYYSGNGVLNPKFRKLGSPGKLRYMNFSLQKAAHLAHHGIVVQFVLKNLERYRLMPFNFGWHPAFRLSGDPRKVYVLAGGKSIPFIEVVRASQKAAYFMEKVSSVELIDEGAQRALSFDAVGTKDMMFWSPSFNSGMMCIEPLTHLPEPGSRYFVEGKYRTLKPGKEEEFMFLINPQL